MSLTIHDSKIYSIIDDIENGLNRSGLKSMTINNYMSTSSHKILNKYFEQVKSELPDDEEIEHMFKMDLKERIIEILSQLY